MPMTNEETAQILNEYTARRASGKPCTDEEYAAPIQGKSLGLI